MDTDIADEKLYTELRVQDKTVKANDRSIENYEIDAVAEKKLLRKLDLRVVPVLWFLFMLAFLDRTNIGNARVLGMEDDLPLVGNDYNIALLIFFPPYIIFEVPSNIIIKRVKPSTWLSALMFFWGICTIGQGLITNNAGLRAMRFLIGFFEAGFYPGCIYLISMYYKRYEVQWRFNLFFTGSILAGAFSGLLAYGISFMDGIQGYAGWRWIFILEGIFTVVVAALSKFVIVDWPENAKFLTEEERELLIARLAADVADSRMNRLDKKAYKRILTDWKIYCGILMYFSIVNNGYAVSFFTPTILVEMGFGPVSAQTHSIPIFIVAAAICLATAWASDYLRHRYAFCIAGICVCTIGYGMLLNQSHIPVGAQYAAVFFIVSGGYMCQPTTIVWINNTMGGHYKRSLSAAMMAGFGNAGGIVASNIFLTSEEPAFPTGYGTTLALVWVWALTCTVFLFGLMWENRKRERGERDYRLMESDKDNLGDDHPHFRFTY